MTTLQILEKKQNPKHEPFSWNHARKVKTNKFIVD